MVSLIKMKIHRFVPISRAHDLGPCGTVEEVKIRVRQNEAIPIGIAQRIDDFYFNLRRNQPAGLANPVGFAVSSDLRVRAVRTRRIS